MDVKRLFEMARGLPWPEKISMMLGNRIDMGSEVGGLISVKQFPILIQDLQALENETRQAQTVAITRDCRDMFMVGSVSWKLLDEKLACVMKGDPDKAPMDASTPSKAVVHHPSASESGAQTTWAKASITSVDLADLGDPRDTVAIEVIEQPNAVVVFGRTDGDFGIATMGRSPGPEWDWDWQTYDRASAARADFESIRSGEKRISEVFGYEKSPFPRP